MLCFLDSTNIEGAHTGESLNGMVDFLYKSISHPQHIQLYHKYVFFFFFKPTPFMFSLLVFIYNIVLFFSLDSITLESHERHRENALLLFEISFCINNVIILPAFSWG